MKNLFIVAFILITHYGMGQNNLMAVLEIAELPQRLFFNNSTSYLEKLPKFYHAPPLEPDTRMPLAKYLKKQIQYPEIAKLYGAEGTALVEIKINALGHPQQITFLKKAHPMLDPVIEEAYNQLPMFRPAIRNGKPIEYTITMPIRFSLY